MSIEFRLYDNRTPFQKDPVQSRRERNPEAADTKRNQGTGVRSEKDRKETASMPRMIERIAHPANLETACRKVKANKGSAGVDGMGVEELSEYMEAHKEEISNGLLKGTYKPQPERRVYIPKPNGKKRPLGIPTVVDRVIQQAVSQQLSQVYEPVFSEYSYGFRPDRSAQQAVLQAMVYLNEGYDWIVDLDIEKFFDRVNQDKLISIIREQMNESEVLGLIRKFLKAGVMENGVKQKTEEGTPQGGPLSPLLANIYLDKFDKELEQRGLRFVRYADDCIIFTKSEKAANRVMASVISWLKRKLFLTASAEKTRVVRPTKGKFLGFTFWKGSDGWKCRPHDDSKKRLKEKIRSVTVRRKAAAIPLAVTFTRINQIVRGWINYYRIGAMSMWLKETFGPWMRHRVRVVILKQWKHRGTIFTNLWKLNGRISHPFPKSYVFAQSMTHCGWYRLGNNEVVNMILNPHILSLKRKDRPGLVDPWKDYSCA